MAQITVLQIQKALVRKGFKVTLDGVMGPETEMAISTFKGANGLRRRPLIGPLTIKLLFGKVSPNNRLFRKLKGRLGNYPPWLNELAKHMNWHEETDNAKLTAWLKSDGAFLGDPSKLPWCGDAMQTAIKLTMPDEPWPGKLGENPYWARNWIYLGEETPLALGAMVVLKRGKGGHIASAVGYDNASAKIRVRGGNQSDSINDTWVSEKRVLGFRNALHASGYRKPVTYNGPLPAIPIMNSAGQIISVNEA